MNIHEQALPTRRTPQTSEIEAGRTQLHRLLDQVLDKAEPYNPDVERQINRGQQLRVNSTAYDPINSLLIDSNQQMHHLPVIPQVLERPDPSLLRVHYNPYDAGDRVHEIQRYTPVELKPKYASDDVDIRQGYIQPSYRSNPPLFYEDSLLTNGAITPSNVSKRQARIHPDNVHEVMMRPNGHRQHRFNENEVYIDTIPKNRNGTRTQVNNNAWTNNEGDNDGFFQLNPSDLDLESPKRNDFHDEYIIAKQSVVNTKKLISSIQDELQQIVSDPLSDDYHA